MEMEKKRRERNGRRLEEKKKRGSEGEGQLRDGGGKKSRSGRKVVQRVAIVCDFRIAD